MYSEVTSSLCIEPTRIRKSVTSAICNKEAEDTGALGAVKGGGCWDKFVLATAAATEGIFEGVAAAGAGAAGG